MKKIITLTSLCIFLLLMTPLKTSADQLDDIETAGEIIIGTDPYYPPMEYMNGTEIVGFSVDFGEAIADYLDVTATFVSVGWEVIIPSLNLGEFDILISSMPITPAREDLIDFSRPYYNFSQGILVATGNPLGIVNEADLNDANITIGVQMGTTSDIWATANAPDATLIKLSLFSDLFLKMDLGELDVILGGFPVIANAANQKLVAGEVIATFGSVAQFGVGIKEDEPTLVAAIDAAINLMLDDGSYDVLFDAWFGPATLDPTDDDPTLEPTDDDPTLEPTDDDAPFEFIPVVASLFFMVGLLVFLRRRNLGQ